MKKHTQNGFTLVELLVVIGIIGMLAAALTAYVPGVIDAARSVTCKANLKHLAQSVITADYRVTAGSFECVDGIDPVTLRPEYKCEVGQPHSRGWVSWAPQSGSWPYSPYATASKEGSMAPAPFYDQSTSDESTKAYFSITNGALWVRNQQAGVGNNPAIYICETHKKELQAQTGGRVYRSYVMNRFFGFNDKNDMFKRSVNKDTLSEPTCKECGTVWDNKHKCDVEQQVGGYPESRLLFAELPGQRGQSIDTKTKEKGDSVLDPDEDEYVGFNHKAGNKWIGNVVFADGHVEGLVQPGKNTSDWVELTKQVCNGTEIEATLRAKMQ